MLTPRRRFATRGHQCWRANQHADDRRYRRHVHRGRGDRGSALLLVPAGILIVLLLGSIAVDLSLVHLTRQEAADAAAAAADDTVTAALDQDALRARGVYVIDERRARQVTAEVLDARGLATTVSAADVVVDGDTVTVTLTVPVRYVFARGVPGARHGTTVTVTASAAVRRR
jgi:Flp pilus assembly protein TadG